MVAILATYRFWGSDLSNVSVGPARGVDGGHDAKADVARTLPLWLPYCDPHSTRSLDASPSTGAYLAYPSQVAAFYQGFLHPDNRVLTHGFSGPHSAPASLEFSRRTSGQASHITTTTSKRVYRAHLCNICASFH